MRVSYRLAGAMAIMLATLVGVAGPILSATPPASASWEAPHIESLPPPPHDLAYPSQTAIPNGYYFSQTGGTADGSRGFTVTNAVGIPFWDIFSAFGGVDELGYPASTRFDWRGTTVQVMQRNILVWNPNDGQVTLGNTFDLLHDEGFDRWLEQNKKVPPPFQGVAPPGASWDQIMDAHLELLLVDDDIRARYFANPNWLDHYGLPVSYQEYGEVRVVRAQRVVFQKWKINTSFAAAGDVTIANGGDVAKEAGLFPQAALVPQPAPIEQGESHKTPWSGWWWPAHVNGGEPQLWQPNGPYAKYDRYVQSLGRPNPDVAGWNRANLRFFGREEEWAGHCNGWAAASILEPEPTYPVTLNGITFSVGDQKGLLTGYHFGDEGAYVVGGRPDGVSPREFRDALQLFLGSKHQPILANIYARSTQVWSAPAFKFETIYGPDRERPNIHHFRTQVWYADYHVAPNYVGTQIFGGEPKVYEYYLEGPLDRPTGGGWQGISASNSEFARPFHLWYPDPRTRNAARWTSALNYDIIKQIVPGAGTAPAEYHLTAGLIGFLSANSGSTPLLPNSFWMPEREQN